MPLHSDEYLERVTKEGERDIARKLRFSYYRFTIAVTANTATYELPEYVREIDSITWKGEVLHPLHHRELQRISWDYLTVTGEPQYYIRSPENILGIRFSPIPTETITASASDNTSLGSTIASKVIVSCYREPDTSGEQIALPDYISRRLLKAYVNYRGFAKDGEGHNPIAADYYLRKYEFLLEQFRKVHERYWNAIERMDDARYDDSFNEPRMSPAFFVSKPVIPLSAGNMFDSMNNWNDSASVVAS